MKLTHLIAASCALGGACVAGGALAAPPPPRDHLNVFISPAGEPFRAGPDEPYPIAAWFARADADHDGALTRSELEADQKTFFQRLDANHDGVIDGFEIADYEQKIAPEILPRVGRLTGDDIPALPGTPLSQAQLRKLDRPMRRRGPGVRAAAFYALSTEPEPVAAADTDFDGKVSLAEAVARIGRQFVRLDVNGDGRLLRAELPQTGAEKLMAKGLAEKARKRR